jgi:chemotaxis methyl-accepting protein methylase
MNWSYESLPELTEQQCLRWEQVLEERTGIFFAEHKGILRSGLRKRMQVIGCKDFDEYYGKVVADNSDNEWAALLCSLTVRETSFFRDPDAYRLVKDELVKKISRSQSEGTALQLWSVGCSSGEEVYSLAMSVLQAQGYVNARDVSVTVSGSDISSTALDSARKGVYGAKALERVTPLERSRWFRKISDSEYCVVDDLKKITHWFQWNITDSCLETLPKMDIIFCQNVLIYFRPQTRKKILDALVGCLAPGGIIVIGSGEVINWAHPKIERVKNDTVQAYRALS